MAPEPDKDPIDDNQGERGIHGYAKNENIE
jgi:hypothetical protein